MKEPTSEKPRKAAKLPKANLGGLASAVLAAVALAQASGEKLPASLAQKFFALLEAELETVVPPLRPPKSEETAKA